MTKLTVDIDADMLDTLYVDYLKKQVSNLEQDFKLACTSDDMMMFIQVHAACLTLIQWMSVHGDFAKYMEKKYGSKPDQGE